MRKDTVSSQPTTPNSRRTFLRTSALALGGLLIVPRHVLGRGFIAPSDKINLGVIGLGKQGIILASRFVGNTAAQVVAGSDVWTGKREVFQQQVARLYAEQRQQADYRGVQTYLDYSELLERSDIDGVIVATPDHWHAIQSIDAMKAGKDVYCEKPLTNTIAEGVDMVESARRYGRVVQTGSMQRSWARFRQAVDIVQSGKLGDIRQVLVSVGDPARPFDLAGEPLPAGLDWDKWCGPAPLLPYHHRIAPADTAFYPDWRFFRETGGGILSDWGAHMFDIAQWALGMDATGPVRYVPPQDRSAKRGLRMYYENGVEMIHEDFGRNWAVRFIGSEGSLDVSRSFLDASRPNILPPAPTDGSDPYKDQGNHYQDWLTAMQQRSRPICDVSIGHRTASVCNIANIAYELGRPLDWDPVRERFRGDGEANKLRKRKARRYA